MSRWSSARAHGGHRDAFVRSLICAVLVAVQTTAAAQERYPGIGRDAAQAELRAWDIDVRGDFQGLPPGSGSVATGRAVWDAKCASCHGTFGESNEWSGPVVGGTTREDIETGRVQALLDPSVPRSTMMKLSRVSTLWDYINRAMPSSAPKTLTTEEVYAVTAYILNLADVVPETFTLSERNMAEVQAKLPNRNGMTRAHGLWNVRGKPDVKNSACMRNCGREVKVTSTLTEEAKAAHGNIRGQMRTIGPR